MLEIGDPPVRLLAAFFNSFPGHTPDCLVKAPDRELWSMATRRETGRFTLVAPDLDGEVSLTTQSALNGQTAANRPLPGWARFPAGVLAALVQNSLPLSGADIAIAGDEPLGPRYDYALGLVVGAALLSLAGQPYTTDQLVGLVETARREAPTG